MSRKRYISTDISSDARINRLAAQHGDFAVLLYTWMIPHAKDDTTLPGDPEELLMLVLPGRRDKSPEDVETALTGMVSLGLIEWGPGSKKVCFPPGPFYKYQTYVRPANRRGASVPQSTDDQQHSAINAEEQREVPNSTASPSLSLSPSPSEEPPSDPRKDPTEGAVAPSDNILEEPEVGHDLRSFDAWLRMAHGCKNDGCRTALLMDMARYFWEPILEDDAGGRAAAVVKAGRGDFGYVVKLFWNTMSDRPSGDPFKYTLGKLKRKPGSRAGRRAIDPNKYFEGRYGHKVIREFTPQPTEEVPGPEVEKAVKETLKGQIPDAMYETICKHMAFRWVNAHDLTIAMSNGQVLPSSWGIESRISQALCETLGYPVTVAGGAPG